MSRVVILCGCFVGKFYSFKLGLLGGVCFLNQESSWILRIWLTSEEQGEWLKVLWLSANPQFLFQALLNLVHRWALGAVEDLPVVRPSVYLRIPGFGVLPLQLCSAVIWRCFLSLWARCWNSPCPFSSRRKRETFMAQWKQKWALALSLSFCHLVFFEFLPLWFCGYNYKTLLVKDMGPPSLSSPLCILGHELTGEVRQEHCVHCFICSSYSHPGCGL